MLIPQRNGSKRLDSGLTVVSFGSLALSLYTLQRVVAMEVGGGTLDIDFQGNSFATQLNLITADR